MGAFSEKENKRVDAEGDSSKLIQDIQSIP